MFDDNATSGASTDGQDPRAAQAQVPDPVDTGKARSDAGAVHGDDRAEQTTTDPIAELFPNLGDDDDDDQDDDDAGNQDQAQTPDGDRQSGENPPQDPDQAKTPDEDPEGTDQGTQPGAEDPPRKRIRNLEKQLKEREAEAKQLMGSFTTLNDLFQRAGLDPAKAADELTQLAKAKDGDAQARAALASRFGIQAEARPAALTAAQTELLKELDLLEAFTQAGNPPASAEAGKAPPAAAGAAATPAAGTPPPGAGATAPGYAPADLSAAEEGMRVIAHGVRAGEPTKAGAILEDAAKRFQGMVEKAAEEFGVRPAPAKWPGLFRKAVGEATAAALAAGPRSGKGTPPRSLPASSKGSHTPSGDPLDEAFPGVFS